MSKLKLMCVLAHPDDESLGAGGVLARYAAEGVETTLITATLGEHGWFGDEADYPGPEALGQIRKGELMAATETLGVKEVVLLGYEDGELDQANPDEAISIIADHLRRIRPDVVITFDPYGVYGHPDHIAISQFTAAAIVAAAAPNHHSYGSGTAKPHSVSKLYYLVETQSRLAMYEDLFGELVMLVDGIERRISGWEDWAITTQINTRAYWQQVWKAVSRHQSQLPGFQSLKNLSEEQHKSLWGEQSFYRAFSLVNGGREIEIDLFAGL